MKTIWIAIMAIVLISLVPLALAAEVTVQGSMDTNTNVGSGGTSAQSDTSAQAGVSANTDRQQRQETRRENMQERRDVRKEAVSVIKDLRNLRKATREEIKTQRQDLKVKLDDLKGCKGQKTQECEESRSAAKASVIASLKTDVDQVTQLLTSAKERISASKLSDKEEIVANIDVQLQAIAQVSVKINALSETSSPAEVKDAAKSLRKDAQEARESLRAGTHRLVSNKLGSVIEQSKKLEARLDKVLSHLKAKGMDTSRVDTANFKAKVDLAASLNQEAVSLFEQSKVAEPGKKDELMRQSTQKLQDSQKALKEAHALLQNILQSIKALKGGNTALTQEASTAVSANAAASASGEASS